MARLSQNQKEIIKTVIFFIVIGVLGFYYCVYPLSRTKAALGRVNVDDYVPDSTQINDPSLFIEAGLTVDTFRVEADGLTTLACLYITAPVDADSVRGTVMLLHADTTDRTAMLPWAQEFVAAGYNAVVYDQRASGYSTGKYHGEGRYEATDLDEVIGWLDLRDRIVHPMVAIGATVGGDAVYLASLEEMRIDGIVSIDPFVTTDRMWNIMKARHDMMWFPFFRTMMGWWYNIRSSYAAPDRELDDIEPVAVPSLFLMPDDDVAGPEVVRLKEESDNGLLTVEALPADPPRLLERVMEFVGQVQRRPLEE